MHTLSLHNTYIS